ncbi:MAG: lysozyme inhibitor LprI family protein [Pseudomonadota bacterium]
MRKKIKKMRMIGPLILLLPLVPVLNSYGASFDCEKATTKVEKIICDNAELSKLDEELNRIYKEALKKSFESEELEKRQKSWLEYWQTQCGTIEDCVRHQWEQQIARLNRVINSPFHKLEDTIFKYELKESHDDQVCQHMLDVFNSKFSTPWASESTSCYTGERSPKDGLPVIKPNPVYGEHGKYAFPKLPGVEHDAEETFKMRLTKLPTSPEFDLISWREGRTISGKGLKSEKNVSILSADFDIDNDCKIETVFKTSSWGVENVYSPGAGEDEYLIYPQGEVDPTTLVDLGILYHHKRDTISGMFIRPFILNGKIYLTAYERTLGALEDSIYVEMPEKEEMMVQLYQKEGDSSSTVMQTVCRYQMVAVEAINNK